MAFLTLGCKVNQYETQAMSEMFLKNRYEIASFQEKADVYVVNSCTVTAMGDKKSRQALNKAKRLNPDGVFVLTGCYAQSLKTEEIKDLGLDVIIGTGNRDKIVDLVQKALLKKETILKIDDLKTHKDFEETPIDGFLGKTRAMIKIEDGCNRFCSYCIIPYVRGNIRSRNLESIVKEAKRLSEKGFKEVVLTGIQVAAYGQDLGKGDLAEVIEKVSEVEGIERIRLSSLEVLAITDDFLQRVYKTGKLCPSFHLSLQSGSETVLKRMNRRYTPFQYEEAVNKIRKYYPDAAITTDIIVGFPGETEEEFKETVDFANKIGFSKIHIFPYSKRKGTKAYDMKDQIEKQVKTDRASRLLKIADTLQEDFIKENIGKTHKILFEQINKDGFYEGYTKNYIKVIHKSDIDLTDKVKSLVLTKDNIVKEFDN